MHVEVLVEEPSAEAALSLLLPKIVGPDVTWMIHPHQGKQDLLAKLPGRLRAYSRWMPPDWAILVLIDADQKDCRELKERLNQAARESGLGASGKRRSGGRAQVVNRIAVEELESWFLGDMEALRAAFTRISPTLSRAAKYRDPDAIKGGTWEALGRVLRRAGYFKEFKGGFPKIATARAIARHMQPDRNQSKSFQVFRDALRRLVKDTYEVNVRIRK